MRIYVAIFIVLVHQILAGIGPTNAAGRGLFFTPTIAGSDHKNGTSNNDASINSSSSEDAAASTAISRCNNSLRLRFSRYSSEAWKNKIDDDKRMVPTGPNPLHNR